MYSDDEEAVYGRTRFQKMVFMLQQRLADDESINTYPFEAYDYGPFSKELYDDIDDLIEQDLIEETREEFDGDKVIYEYELTDKGQGLISQIIESDSSYEIFSLSEDLKQEFNQKDLSELLDIVYSEYPEYARNSVL